MKVNSIEVSPTAYNLIQSFNEWIEASSKIGYKFTDEEQHYLELMISILNNRIDMLVDYELKHKGE